MRTIRVLALVALICRLAVGQARAEDWYAYGGDAGGTRYSTAGQIDRGNVTRLSVAWTYHTGEAMRRGKAFGRGAFEATPILVDDKLVFCTPFNRLVALDPATGKERWVFDPWISLSMDPAQGFTCRGVAVWHDRQAAPEAACATRIFMATNDARLFAVDAATGTPCAGFGNGGSVANPPDVPTIFNGEYQITSPPTVAGDTVILGSALADNFRLHGPTGRIGAFDARSGAPLWHFDPVPRSDEDPAAATWTGDSWRGSGGGEMWSAAAVDAERDLVFLPMGGATPTFFSGNHPGDNLYTDAVVALRASTGALVWQFQTVHHDIWDYDPAAQPTLATIHRDGKDIPAVVEATKMGFVFILDRETGKPLFPVEERPVPASDVPGEAASPTEPVPLAPPPLVPQRLSADYAWGILYFDRRACARKIAGLRSDGLYTPPSLKGSIEFPFTGGGVNWGSGALDPGRNLLVLNNSRLAHVIRLIPRADYAQEKAAHPDREINPQLGTPYGVERSILLSPIGLPCNAPPWGALSAVDLDRGTIAWSTPLGRPPDILGVSLPLTIGTPSIGGPIVTAGGLIFIGSTLDRYFRAFDVESGRELWRTRLPFAGHATPMTYEAGGRQFVVIAAGGYFRAGGTVGDALVAFALPP